MIFKNLKNHNIMHPNNTFFINENLTKQIMRHAHWDQITWVMCELTTAESL